MPWIKTFCSICAAALLTGGCAVVSVTGAAVSIGVSAVSTTVDVATTVAKGVVNAGTAVVEKVAD